MTSPERARPRARQCATVQRTRSNTVRSHRGCPLAREHTLRLVLRPLLCPRPGTLQTALRKSGMMLPSQAGEDSHVHVAPTELACIFGQGWATKMALLPELVPKAACRARHF